MYCMYTYIWYLPFNNDNLGFCYVSDCNRLQIYFSEIHGSKIQDPRCHGGLGSEILDPSWIQDPRIQGSKIQDARFPGGLGGVTMLVFNLPGSRINSSLF